MLFLVNRDYCSYYAQEKRFLHFFQERLVTPHLKHDYNSVCNGKLEQADDKPVTSKLSRLFRWLFSLENDDERSHKVEL